jgi:hypothetical protein
MGKLIAGLSEYLTFYKGEVHISQSLGKKMPDAMYRIEPGWVAVW